MAQGGGIAVPVVVDNVVAATDAIDDKSSGPHCVMFRALIFRVLVVMMMMMSVVIVKVVGNSYPADASG